MKYLIILLFIIVSFIAILININYDIYSYHIWSYTANYYGISQIYNNGNYFDRWADYPPLGVYMYIIPGKVVSLFKPLSVSSIPFLFIYKLIPLLFFFIIVILLKGLFNTNKLLMLSIISIGLFVSMTAQNDIIILLLLLLGIKLLDNNENAGILFIIITIFIKQTAFFFAVFILLAYWYKRYFNLILLKRYIIIGISLFIVFFIPFIIKGQIINSLNSLFFNTVFASSPLSISFNVLSIIPNADLIDYNFKLFNLVSIKTISIFFIFIAMTIIILFYARKKSLLFLMALFSIIWFNIMVGLREQHIVYTMFFLAFLKSKKRIINISLYIYIILFIISAILNNSTILMSIFNTPKIPNILIIILSIIQTITALAVIYSILKDNAINHLSIPSLNIHIKHVFITIIIIMIIVSIPGRVEREKDFFSYIIENKLLLDYSKDKYIDLNVVSLSPFKNYLGIRMSDKSWFEFLKNNIKTISFYYTMEYANSGDLFINDSLINVNYKRNKLVLNLKSDTIFIKANIKKEKANIMIYNAKIMEFFNE